MKEDLELKLKLLLPFILKGDKAEMLIPFGIAEDILAKAGFIFDGSEMETNGWQVDYWINMVKDNDTYKVSGSMYYGDFKIQKQK